MKTLFMIGLLGSTLGFAFGLTGVVRSRYLSDVERAKMDIYAAEKEIEKAERDIKTYSAMGDFSVYPSYVEAAQQRRNEAIKDIKDLERKLKAVERSL